MCAWRVRWFAVEPDDLLTGSVRKTGEDAGLGDSGTAFVFENAANRNAAMAEGTQQLATGLIVSNDADGKNVDPQVRKIADRVGASAGNDFAIAVSQDEDRSLAGYARNFAKYELVGNQ